MFEIRKEIGRIDMGHNVWVQELDNELSCNSESKCLKTHGHSYRFIAYLRSPSLSKSQESMVLDFNEMNIMKNWIDSVLDHQYLMDINDPIVPDTFHHFFKNYLEEFKTHSLDYFEEGYWMIKPELYKDMPKHLQNKYKSYVLVDFVPTAENIAKWLTEVMDNKIKKSGLKVYKMEVFETPKSVATYYNK